MGSAPKKYVSAHPSADPSLFHLGPDNVPEYRLRRKRPVMARPPLDYRPPATSRFASDPGKRIKSSGLGIVTGLYS